MGALFVSAFAHALAAVSTGIVLRSSSVQAPQQDEAIIEIDVTPLATKPQGASQEAWPQAISDRLSGTPPHRESLRRHLPTTKTTAAPPAPVGPTPVLIASPYVRGGDHEGRVPRFTLRESEVATQLVSTAGVVPGEGDAAASGPTGVFVASDVTVPAHLLWSSPALYPLEARKAEIELDLPLEIVIGTDGCVVAAWELTRVGYGLDESALRAIRGYRFSPAKRDGQPVRVRMRWTMEFRLR